LILSTYSFGLHFGMVSLVSHCLNAGSSVFTTWYVSIINNTHSQEHQQNSGIVPDFVLVKIKLFQNLELKA